MADLMTMIGQVQVLFGGRTEGTVSNLRISASRGTPQVGVASGENITGEGIQKVSVSFDRPALKVSTGQISDATLLGPVDIDVVRGDQVWRLVKFRRNNLDFSANPDAGSSTESVSGVANKLLRVK